MLRIECRFASVGVDRRGDARPRRGGGDVARDRLRAAGYGEQRLLPAFASGQRLGRPRVEIVATCDTAAGERLARFAEDDALRLERTPSRLGFATNLFLPADSVLRRAGLCTFT